MTEILPPGVVFRQIQEGLGRVKTPVAPDYHTAKTLPDGVLCSCGKTFPGHRKQRGHALDELRKIIKGLTQSLVTPE